LLGADFVEDSAESDIGEGAIAHRITGAFAHTQGGRAALEVRRRRWRPPHPLGPDSAEQAQADAEMVRHG
jgi:hypothetical protein